MEGCKTYQTPAGGRRRDEAPEEPPALGKVGVGLVLEARRGSTAVVQMHRGGNGGSVAKEGVRQRDVLVDDHVDHADDPGRVQQGEFRRAAPEGVGDGECRVEARADNVQKRVVEDRVDGVVRELLLQPRRPVVAVHFQVFDLAPVELGRVVAVADGDAVLRLHKVGHDLGIHGVVPPGLADGAVRAVGHVPAHLAPDPGEVDAGVPDSRFIGG